MMEKLLMKGNEAIAEAAIRAGCLRFYGYPITPQTEVSAYMSKKMPKVGGLFMQAESEIAAINMVYGSAAAGVRAMTSSSSPGISLKAEGISYIAGADLPCVVLNIVRGGPGLGGIQPAQSDYFQATKGLAHGDFQLVVLAPSSIQECVDLTYEAFDIADQYRMPVMLIGDGMLGQMMEPVTFPEEYKGRDLPEKTWATNGTQMKRKHNVVNSLYIEPNELEKLVVERYKKYDYIKETEVKYETENIKDADVVLVAYGTIARIAKSAMQKARNEGIKVGLIRPITLWPFPEKIISETAKKAKSFLAVEMSMGQMVEDVRLAVNGQADVHFYGRTGGVIPTPDEVYNKIIEIAGGAK
ncbi:MAG: 3-methyl-2-oxobutanoate dehydrogenase subunit VorB [Clostridia bacterium]|nr:3-methyl-2-oxobutanoate dehydrogenase subunit VorB [Clostridia bacterium]